MEYAKQIVSAVRFQIRGGVERLKSIECGLAERKELSLSANKMSMNKWGGKVFT